VAEQVADIDRARDAIVRESWTEAYEEFERLDPSSLRPEDLDGFADAAWWLSEVDESIALRQQAYTRYAEEGRELRAGWCAGRLCIEHFLRGEPSVGSGWLMRARRHLADRPEGVEHGYLAMLESTIARFGGGELDAALAQARQAVRIGRRFRDPDLIATSIHSEGLIHVAAGRIAEGMALLDEAMASVLGGGVSAFFTGAIYCDVIDACLQATDLGRATEWSRAAMAWAATVPPRSPFPGVCRVNRAHLARLSGAWPEALRDAEWAAAELVDVDPETAGAAYYEAGEIRRRTGDLAGAESDFARARELGFDPQPGLALLRLAQGRADAARTSLQVALSKAPSSGLRDVPLFAAQVEVALAVIEPDEARASAERLRELATTFATPAVHAASDMAVGAVELAAGDVPAALESLRRACATWRDLKLPYETARARTLYGLALREAGDHDDADLELRASHQAFERLGAVPEAADVAELLGRGPGLPRGLTAREAEVLRLVATGKSNRDIAVELVISEHTVARHLQNIYAKLDVPSRAAATAFAFEHGLA
jgi:DNA-binding CsgD family transcriptional regulator